MTAELVDCEIINIEKILLKQRITKLFTKKIERARK